MKRLVRASGLLLAAAPLSAQTMRSYDYARPMAGEKQLRAVVDFAAGKLAIKPSTSRQLYNLVLQYDAERFQPLGSYNASTAEVRLGVKAIGGGGLRVNSRSALPQVALVELPAAVDLTLAVTIGAAEGTLELGGLRLSDLEMSSGASAATVSFSTPGKGSCRTAAFTSGAGQLTINQAGNAGCRSWRFDGGVGEVTLDLAGAWPADARMTLSTALGGVTLVAPRGLGLKVTMGGFMADFDADGFSKSGRTYTSAGYDKATRHLDVDVRSALGGVKVEWR